MRNGLVRAAWAGSVGLAAITFVVAVQADDADPNAELKGDDIIVSGDRTERTLLQSTTAVSIVDGDLAARNGGDETISEIVAPLPNVFVEGPSEVPTIRGVQGGGAGGLASSGTTGAPPRTAIIRDGIARPANIPNSSFTSMFDVEQVEVLRGPQNLLFGRTGFAGLVVIDTKDPTFEPEGAAQFGMRFDEFNGTEYTINAMASGALTDNIAGRLVLEYADGDDPRNVIGGPADFITEYDRIGARGKLLGLFETGIGDLEVELLLEHQTGQTPQTRNNVLGPGLGFDPADREFAANGPTRTFDAEATTAVLNLTLDGDDWSLESITGFTTDEFISVPEQVEPTRFDFSEQIYSQELLLRFGPQDDLLAGQLGGLAGLAFEERRVFGTTSGLLGSDLETSTSSQSVFLDLRYGLTDALSLQAGARLMRYKADRTQFSSVTLPAPPPIFVFTVQGQQNQNETDIEFLPALGLSYELTDNQVISLSGRRGYNPGGASVNFFTGAPYTFDAERVWTGEVTYRADLPGPGLTLGATAFYNLYDDPQFFAELVPGNRATLQVVNQDQGQSFGAEFEATFRPIDDLQLGASLGLLVTEITEASAATPGLEGNSFGQDPAITAAISAQYQVTDWFGVDAQLSYRGESENDFNNVSGDEVGDYFILDLGATVEYEWATLRGFVKNATNTAGVTRRVSDSAFVDVTEPLSVGLTLTVDF